MTIDSQWTAPPSCTDELRVPIHLYLLDQRSGLRLSECTFRTLPIELGKYSSPHSNHPQNRVASTQGGNCEWE